MERERFALFVHLTTSRFRTNTPAVASESTSEVNFKFKQLGTWCTFAFDLSQSDFKDETMESMTITTTAGSAKIGGFDARSISPTPSLRNWAQVPWEDRLDVQHLQRIGFSVLPVGHVVPRRRCRRGDRKIVCATDLTPSRSTPSPLRTFPPVRCCASRSTSGSDARRHGFPLHRRGQAGHPDVLLLRPAQLLSGLWRDHGEHRRYAFQSPTCVSARPARPLRRHPSPQSQAVVEGKHVDRASPSVPFRIIRFR